MKKGCLAGLLCMLICIPTGFAQKKQPVAGGKVFIRMYLPGLIDPMDNNITAGFEYKLSPRWSVMMDAGLVFTSLYYNEYKSYRTSGYILRPGIRRYFSEQNKWFLEAQFHYKQVIYKVEDWVDRGMVNGVSAYEEFTTFHYRKNAAGINIIGGIKKSVGKRKKAFFEFYAGAGIRYKEEGAYHAPEDMRIRDSGIKRTFGGNIFPALPVGVRFIWRLN